MEGLRVLLAGIALFWSATAYSQTLPNPPAEHPGLLSSIGFISVLLSTANLPVKQDIAHTVQYTLKDGTRVGGLLYIDSSKGMRPLIIADFGLMSSTSSTLAGDVIEKIVNAGLLNANFLVVDDITGAGFYTANESLSLGGYDAGRVLNQLADELAEQRLPFTSLHLMGESLGGLAVLEALIEDHRIGANHFQSAITFSGVTDEDQATATVMSAFNYSLNGISGPNLPLEGKIFLSSSVSNFDSAVTASKTGFPNASGGAGSFFYNQFKERLIKISEAYPSDWNPEVSRVSVESYIETSAALVHTIGQISVPVILVHAQNDPVVDYSEFESFAESQQSNPRVLTLGTKDGSHCGFLGVYGASWVAGLINRALSL
jgi:predicted alpha/beta-fold hydrolase